MPRRCQVQGEPPRVQDCGGGEFAIIWTPGVCKIMAFMAIIRGLGPLFYIFLGFR